MQIQCPCCHARYGLEAAVEQEAARELQKILADLPRDTSRPLVHYLGLFRSRTRALAWERALRTAREALAVHDDVRVLGAALSETVDAMRDKQQQANWRPLKNHNYLKRVVESVAAQGTALAATGQDNERPLPRSKTGQGMIALQEGKRRDE